MWPQPLRISLLPVHRGNWERVLALQPAPGQEAYQPPVAHSLLHAHYEGLTASALYANGSQLVGYTVWGPVGGVPWVSRLLVDAAWQGQGVATQALALVLDRLRLLPAATEARASLAHGNVAALRLFTRHGFAPTGYSDAFEFVVSRPL
jgi:diamine N-acetyltransferase